MVLSHPLFHIDISNIIFDRFIIKKPVVFTFKYTYFFTLICLLNHKHENKSLIFRKEEMILLFSYYYRVNNWEPIFHLLQQSLYAEEMVCAMSSELYHIPQTKNLKGNNEMHSHLVPASYHRITAVGSSRRLINGEQQQSIIETMVACILNAETQDKKVRDGLYIMEENASPEFKSFIKVIIQWQEQAEAYLKQAKESLRSMGVSFPSGSEQQSGGY